MPRSCFAKPESVTPPVAGVEVMVPSLLRSPVTARAKLATSTVGAPAAMVRSRIVAVPLSTGALVGPAGMRTSSVSAGTAPVLQLPGVNQSLLTAPVQVTTGAAGGQLITAPLLAWKNGDPAAGTELVTSIVSGTAGPSRSFATRWKPPAVSVVLKFRASKVKAAPWPTLFTVSAVPTGLWLSNATWSKALIKPPERTRGTPSKVSAVLLPAAVTSAPPAVRVPVPETTGPLVLGTEISWPATVTFEKRVRVAETPVTSRSWIRLLDGFAMNRLLGEGPARMRRWVPLAKNEVGTLPLWLRSVTWRVPAVRWPVSSPPLKSAKPAMTRSAGLVMVSRPVPVVVLKLPWPRSRRCPARISSPCTVTVEAVRAASPDRATTDPAAMLRVTLSCAPSRVPPPRRSTKSLQQPTRPPAIAAGPSTVRVTSPSERVAPASSVNPLTVTLPPSCGWLAGPAGTSTSSVAVGTLPVLQLPAVFQSLSTAPVQVTTPAAAGQLMTAPFTAWMKPPAVPGVGFTRSTVKGTAGPSVSVAER